MSTVLHILFLITIYKAFIKRSFDFRDAAFDQDFNKLLIEFFLDYNQF